MFGHYRYPYRSISATGVAAAHSDSLSDPKFVDEAAFGITANNRLRRFVRAELSHPRWGSDGGIEGRWPEGCPSHMKSFEASPRVELLFFGEIPIVVVVDHPSALYVSPQRFRALGRSSTHIGFARWKASRFNRSRRIRRWT